MNLLVDKWNFNDIFNSQENNVPGIISSSVSPDFLINFFKTNAATILFSLNTILNGIAFITIFSIFYVYILKPIVIDLIILGTYKSVKSFINRNYIDRKIKSFLQRKYTKFLTKKIGFKARLNLYKMEKFPKKRSKPPKDIS